MTDRTKVESAFRATTYRVSSIPPIDLRIGKTSPAADALLESYGTTFAVYVTSDNPGATHHDDASNRRDRKALKERLAAFSTIDGESIADDAGWPIEHGVIVPGMSKEEGIDLGRRFGQVAILWLVAGEPVAMQWCEA